MHDEANQFGYTFLSQARWRFLNILHLPHGPEADRKNLARYTRHQKRYPHVLGLVFDRFDDFTRPQIDSIAGLKSILDSLAGAPWSRVGDLLDAGHKPTSAELTRCAHLELAGSEFEPLRAALNSWAHETNLDPVWIKDVALQTLTLWHRDRGAFRARLWELPEFDLFAADPPMVVNAVWTPASGESLNHFRKRLDQQYRASRNLHLADLRERAQSEGWLVESRRFKASAYLWTAQHRVLGWSKNKTAVEAGVDKKQVHQAACDLSRLLDFTARARPKRR